MKFSKPLGALCLAALLAATYSYAGDDGVSTVNKDGDAKSVVALEGKSVLKLLEGVAHLSDNDIRLKTPDGICVFVDPVKGPEDKLAVKSDLLKPDLILITHPHGDHFQPEVLQEYLRINPKAIVAGPPGVVKLAKEKGIKMNGVKLGQDYTMAGVSFRAVPAYFKEGDSHPKKNQWAGYVLKLNGASYYVTGDTQPLPDMADIKADVLLPLLFGCGGNIQQAVEMSEVCKASVVVPVHHGGNEEVIKKFLAELPKNVKGAYYYQSKLVTDLN